MAEKIVSDIKSDFLTCGLCNKIYTAPKALPCLHTFCRKCVISHMDKHVITAGDGTKCVFCPTCRQICDIPQNGVDGLQDNHLLRNLLDMIQTEVTQNCDVCRDDGKRAQATYVCIKCEDFLCNECSKIHKKTRVTRDHLVMKISNMREMYQSTSNKDLVPENIYVRKLAAFGNYGDDLCDPIGLVSNKADDVIISNVNNSISIFSLAGKCKKTINQNLFYGTEKNCLSNKCVGMTMEGYIAVAMRKDTTSNQAIVAVTETFANREVGIYGVKTSKPLECHPYGIAVMSNNNVVVTDIGKHCVYIFNVENQLIVKEGKWGSRNSQFKYPYHVTVNSSNDILISDYGNHCVKILNSKAKFKLKLGDMGTADGQFMHPAGICTDRYGNIFVCDRDNHRIQMFSDVGKFVALIVKNTCKDGMDIRPQDVAVTTHGHLLVLLKGVEGVDFAQVHVYQYTTIDGNCKFDQEAKQQLYALRESLDSLSLLAPPRTPTTRRLPPLDPRSNSGSRRLDSLPSAPVFGATQGDPKRPDLLPDRVGTGRRNQGNQSRTTDPAPSSVCVIL